LMTTSRSDATVADMAEAHIRIDEGVKRGPRKPHKLRDSIKARDIAGRVAPTIPPGLDPAVVLLRYLTEERTVDIAASYGVTRPALNMWLLAQAEDGWKQAQVARAISRKEAAEEELDGAPDPLTLARAREKLRGAQWDLERICSRIFGIKQEVTVDINHHVKVEHGLTDQAADLLSRIRGPVAETPKPAIAAVLQPIIDIEPDPKQS
jgi:hypothetical protein